VLTRLGHRTVGGGHDRIAPSICAAPVNHVLDVVGVPGAVDVRVVPLLGLVLDMRDRDRDTALPLSGALSIWSNARCFGFMSGTCRANREIAAVSVVLPWSM